MLYRRRRSRTARPRPHPRAEAEEAKMTREARDVPRRFYGLVALAAVSAAAGCATQNTVPPLYAKTPQPEALGEPRVLPVPAPPPTTAIPIFINIPQKKTTIGPENSVMRQGTVVRSGASVVISVPSATYQPPQDGASLRAGDDAGLGSEGSFGALEQYVERGLLAAGLQVKDRAKFEAKLRDARDAAKSRGSADGFSIALESLKRDLDGGKITRDEFTDKVRQLRDKLADDSAGSRPRAELTDVSELIRAAQDGDVMADYVLQVNELDVTRYAGAPLQLAARPEVQAALVANPGLRVGGEPGKSIPATLPQPWAQARFDAKLIDAKTGSIDWIGEYAVDSLAVLDGGVTITIGARRRTVNANAVTAPVAEYDDRVRDAHKRAAAARSELEKAYASAMQPLRNDGPAEKGEAMQNARRADVETAERNYQTALAAYQETVRKEPAEAHAQWTYEYDVDAPVVSPDLFNPKSEEERLQLVDHVKALASKVTRELLGAIKVGRP
jgi:hypothetical protein